MKIIDLYNKVANGEELPKLIKYDGEEYKLTKILLEDNNYYFNYINEDMECIFPINTNHLNDTVEILEEQKKIPEKLETYKENNEIFLESFCYKNLPIHKDSLSSNEQVIVDKLNEIINYIKSKGDNSNE